MSTDVCASSFSASALELPGTQLELFIKESALEAVRELGGRVTNDNSSTIATLRSVSLALVELNEASSLPLEWLLAPQETLPENRAEGLRHQVKENFKRLSRDAILPAGSA